MAYNNLINRTISKAKPTKDIRLRSYFIISSRFLFIYIVHNNETKSRKNATTFHTY